MDFQLNEEEQAVVEMCTQFGETEITPRIRELEDAHELPRDVLKKMADLGLLTMTISEEDGGSSLGPLAYALAIKSIAKADAGLAVTMSVTNMVIEAIRKFGRPEQYNKYIPQLASGDMIAAAFALTESMAGSNPMEMRTKATIDPNDGDYFLLNGEKIFISHGDASGIIIVMAKTDPALGGRGITAFLVEPEDEGFAVGKKEEKMGILTSSTVSLNFDNCRVHKSRILGELGKGLNIAFSSLDSGRIGISAQAIGIAEAAFEAAASYATERFQSGKKIIEHQGIQFKLADMLTKLNACRMMLYQAVSLKAAGQPFTQEAAMAKLFCTENCNQITYDAIQVFGGYGYIKEYPVEKYYRDARINTIYEGTSEIQKIVIGRGIMNSFSQ
ncbi:MAG: acyl-CoA dehydrogenase [SAR324 cluster bacterium]|uniref:Acyl-CoA dehydrogenase n=1 Tax=SAR324 cluster bacterium TaxID=2024889 RepID=A0A2A4T768_9DELT|nr:MAG: acyl-CoA dehydrogenase [SAR324 cluster bacterium]